MNTPNDVIAHGLTRSQGLLQRFVADLSPSDWLHRPAAKANCAAWIVGHLTLSDRRVLGLMGAAGPELPAGFEQQFSRDEGCPQAEQFGDVSRLMPVFNANRDRLVEAVRAATPELLNRPLENPRLPFGTVGEAANFMSLHVAMHAGQISTIRRSLGRPPVM